MKKSASSSNYNMRCFLFCLCIALVSFLYYIISGDGVFTLRDDFNAQQIPFTVSLHKAILDGGLSGFDWSIDLGTSTIQAFSFYELGSPFFWLSMLFPANFFPYVVGWIYILKYAAAGLFACLYLSRFVKNKEWAVVGGILYAFCGFQNTNLLFYHFHDVVAFFPLLPLGLEMLITAGNRKKERLVACVVFSFSVFINCTINYFFFIQEVVFIILYYLFRLYGRYELRPAKGGALFKYFFTNAIVPMLCAIIGVGMSAVIFLPSIMYILQNPRAESALYLDQLVYDSRGLLFILKGLLFPADPMHDQSILIPQQYESTCCYLPLIGIVLAAAYIHKNKDALSGLLITLLICSFSPILSAGFLGFTETYQRWWYCMALILILASLKVMENPKNYLVTRCSLVIFIITLCYSAGMLLVKWSKYEAAVYHPYRFIIISLISLSGTLAIAFLSRKSIITVKNMLILVSVFAVITTSYTLYNYRVDSIDSPDYMEDLNRAAALEKYIADNKLDTAEYRFDVNNNNLFSFISNTSPMSSFISTNALSTDEFEALFDYYSTNNGLIKTEIPGLTQLLGGRYKVTKKPRSNQVIAAYDEANMTWYPADEKNSSDDWYLTQQDVCPIASVRSSFIKRSELKKLDLIYRGIALMMAAEIKDEDLTPAITDLLTELTADDVMEYIADQKSIYPDLDEEQLLEDIADELSNSLSDMTISSINRNGHGLSFNTNFNQRTVVYLSIPYDDGFTARYNNQPISAINSGGMQLLILPEGANSIEISYCTPFYKEGLIISLMCFALWCGTIIYAYLVLKPADMQNP